MGILVVKLVKDPILLVPGPTYHTPRMMGIVKFDSLVGFWQVSPSLFEVQLAVELDEDLESLRASTTRLGTATSSNASMVPIASAMAASRCEI